ncbi:MAG: hypothetical protein SGBAC_007493 [Bacillariaceae sp.]
MASTPVFDPFTNLTQYNTNYLIWASKTRGSLEQPPPFQLTQDDSDGSIRVSQVVSKFLETTGIQVGFQLLELQGKRIADYEGGFEEIQKVIRETLKVDVVVLQESCSEDDSSAEASETCNKENRTSITKANKDSQNRLQRRHTIHDPGDGWVKISPIPKKEEKKPAENPFAAIEKRYRHVDLLWACNNRCSARQPVPMQLGRDDGDGIIRIQQVDPSFQEATGVQVGQRVVQLQEKDIASYQDVQEMQDIVQETLNLNLIVLRETVDESKTVQSHPKTVEKEETPSAKESSATATAAEVTKPPRSEEEEISICTAASSTDVTESEDLIDQPTSEPSLTLVEKPESSTDVTESEDLPEQPTSEPSQIVVEEPPVQRSKTKRGWFKSKLFRKRVSAPA